LRGSLENLDDQSQKSRRKDKDEKKRVIRVKICSFRTHPHKDGGAAGRI
jgi:hypothetical protein